MEYKVNCYTLYADTPTPGIRITSNPLNGPWGVAIGGNEGFFIRLGDEDRERKPLVRRRKVVRAQNYLGKFGKPRLILPSDHWQGLLLRVVVQDLDFRMRPLVKGLNLNPGGEGPPPVVQHGAHNDRHRKDQLFALGQGEQIFVVDHKAAVLTVTCKNGVPVTRPATREEMVAYITAYGLRAKERNSVTWAMHTLRELGAEAHAGLQQRLTDLQTN